jgi:enoyl-CoA hydratase/carnithine racemase
LSTDSTVITRDRSALWITINRPDDLNALTPDVIAGLNAACDEVDKDQTIRALVITGSSGGTTENFSVGMDINFLGKCFADIDGVFIPFVTSVHKVLLRLESLEVPVIAAVNGFARAGGFELLVAADLVVIADEARIGDLHVASGLPPGAGATFRSRNKLGEQRAKALLFSSSTLTGPEAVAAGLALAVNKLVSTFNKSPRNALAKTKAGFTQTQGLTNNQSWEVEIGLFREFLLNDPMAAEGFNSFKEGRKPNWL